MKNSDCSSCHAVDQKVVGPSYTDVAKRYKGQADAVDKLVAKIKKGGSGNWGAVPMTPHPSLADAQLKQIVDWILALGNPAPLPAGQQAGATAQQTAGQQAGTPPPAGGSNKVYSYKLADGTTVKLDFPLFVEGQQTKVTKAVFHGYENFDSYCYRCHGQDATGSEIAPDLRHSLSTGMTEQQFLSVAMAGRQDKGMPSWAGFLSPEEVGQIYEYVKGRSLDLVPVGRPPSEMD